MRESALQPEHESEARQFLVGLARGAFEHIAPERIADHVVAVTEGCAWPVRRAAMLALARRYRFATRDELRVVERPSRGARFGLYRTSGVGAGKRSARSARPYETALLSLAPLAMSCSCADFVRSSLGLCKHALTVLAELEEGGSLPTGKPPQSARAVLRWQPTVAPEGSLDRLERLRCESDDGALPGGLAQGALSQKLLGVWSERAQLIAELEALIAKRKVDAEPAVVTLLREERERVERALAASSAWPSAERTLKQLKRKLYPYQVEGVRQFLTRGCLLLADDMGLGKTTQAIASAHALFVSGSIQRGLLIVPSALKPQWKREWEATTKCPIVLVEGAPKERQRQYRATKQGFLLIGYEQLVRDLERVQRFGPELVVLDEAQRIKNWATKSAAYVKALTPRYRLVLTGTPMENRLDELASIMDFVDDVALEPKWRLAPYHTVAGSADGSDHGGVQHLNVLRARLANSLLRRVRKEVLAQLPARTDTRVPVDLTERQQTAHEELRRPIAELASIAARRPLRPAEFMRLMQLLMKQRMICNGMAQVEFAEHWPELSQLSPTDSLLEGLSAPKLAAFRALIEQVVLVQRRKVVVFSQWRNMLTLAHWAVRDLLAAENMRAVFFTGAESSSAREQAIVELHDDPRTTVMFLSDAGGVGLNLQRAASVCINLELPWNPAVLEQRIGRIHRLGQKQPVDIYNLVSEQGIEARIALLVANKRALFSSLFDGTSDAVRFEGQRSFMASVKQLVELEPVVVPEGVSVTDEEQELVLNAAEAEPLEQTPSQSAPPSLSQPSPQAEQAAQTLALLGGLSVTRRPDGGLRVEAPAELAEPLAQLLESLARSLRAPTPEANAAE